MKQKILYTLLICFNLSFAQERFESKTFGFSIDAPAGWFLSHDTEVPKNVELTPEQKKDLLKGYHSALLGFYYKITLSGLNPKIQFNIAIKQEDSFEEFKKAVIYGAKKIDYLDNLKFIVQPTEVKVGGIKSMYFSMTYTVPESNKTIRSTTYAIPYNKYMYNINFLDIPSDEDCSVLFEKLIQTIKIE